MQPLTPALLAILGRPAMWRQYFCEFSDFITGCNEDLAIWPPGFFLALNPMTQY